MSIETKKKLITIAVPVYNEQECLKLLYERICDVMHGLSQYEYEIVFFDDGSVDASRAIIAELCEKDNRCKAVFFAGNYGYNCAIFYAIQQSKGDCAILLHADLQNPPELIPNLIREWERGSDVVFGIKNKSRENHIMFFLRTVMYWVFNVIFGMHLIPHATDFELIDAKLINRLRQNRQSEPILRIILRESAQNPQYLHYTQDRRVAGQSKFSLKKYYELAVSWIAAGSKVLPRRFLCTGLLLFIAGLVELFAGFIAHFRQGEYLASSTALITRVLLLLICIAVCFISLMAEYWLKYRDNTQQPMKIEEEKRIDY